jgi:endonuclease-3
MTTNSIEDKRAKALEIYRRLLATYGERPLTPRREPMHELISTMLSHRTTQANEALAFERMWERFGSWEAIRDAPLDDLIAAIEPATFPEPKAARIQEALARIIAERGEPSLDFLRDLPAEEGLAWLMALPGVGIKTASLVLLFCFSKPLLPVDTHVHRVSQRVGLIGPKTSAEAAHKLLLDLLPNDPPLLFNFHVSMLKHGQQICVWESPRCGRCPLADRCEWYAARRASPPK